MNKASVHHITDTLSSDAICARLGVSHHSVRYARTDGAFPASWYGPLKEMCDETGIPCPLTAFNWKTSEKKIGRQQGDCKAAGEENIGGAA